MSDVLAKLQAAGYRLPEAPKPVAAYVPAVQTGNLLIVSGQLPFAAGRLLATGPCPSEVVLDHAQEAAVQCLLNSLAIVSDAIDDDWDRLVRVVKLGVFVQSEDGYGEQPLVANGASELCVEVFGDRGKHARAAIGVNALPLNATVEIEAMYEIR